MRRTGQVDKTGWVFDPERGGVSILCWLRDFGPRLDAWMAVVIVDYGSHGCRLNGAAVAGGCSEGQNVARAAFNVRAVLSQCERSTSNSDVFPSWAPIWDRYEQSRSARLGRCANVEC